jgi:hypothetical protein
VKSRTEDFNPSLDCCYCSRCQQRICAVDPEPLYCSFGIIVFSPEIPKDIKYGLKRPVIFFPEPIYQVHCNKRQHFQFFDADRMNYAPKQTRG